MLAQCCDTDTLSSAARSVCQTCILVTVCPHAYPNPLSVFPLALSRPRLCPQFAALPGRIIFIPFQLVVGKREFPARIF